MAAKQHIAVQAVSVAVLALLCVASLPNFALADTTAAPTTTTGSPPTNAPTPKPTDAPGPAPADEPMTQGKKFGISLLVFTCLTIVWLAFTFVYAKVVDHCGCCQKGDDSDASAQQQQQPAGGALPQQGQYTGSQNESVGTDSQYRM